MLDDGGDVLGSEKELTIYRPVQTARPTPIQSLLSLLKPSIVHRGADVMRAGRAAWNRRPGRASVANGTVDTVPGISTARCSVSKERQMMSIKQ